MAQALIVLVVFVVLTLVAAAFALFVRDLTGVAGKAAAEPTGTLFVHDLGAPPPGPWVVSSLDRRISMWLADGGVEMNLTTAGLVLALFSVAFGGTALLLSEDPVIAGIGVMIGVTLPLMLLMISRTRRLRKIQGLLPDVFDLLARAVRAGQSLEQAMETAAQRAPEPLGMEFRRCSRQIQMGLSVPDVTRLLADRVRLLEMRIFALAVNVHRQTGGNLTLTLERMAGVVRERLASHQQLRAATGAGRFSAIMISCIGPLLFLYMFVFQYDYARRLIAEPTGQLLLVIAVALEIAGIIWILRLLRRS